LTPFVDIGQAASEAAVMVRARRLPGDLAEGAVPPPAVVGVLDLAGFSEVVAVDRDCDDVRGLRRVDPEVVDL
jgi:hypothetical protein